ncbi:MAG: N-acetylmuramidase [Proteobacteria bacterium]|nr:MAG: N-acetylmuramidase [Pseudomonadota bacterium]
MANFGAFLPTLLSFEGGFVDDPVDPGGATNKGITLNTFSGCAGPLLGVASTLENLRALTDEQAGRIYKALYWDKMRGDDVGLQQLANIVVDFYVNAGITAARLLQSSMNACGAQPSLEVDGIIGSTTVRILARVDQPAVYRRYKQSRLAYYQDLVANHPLLGKFLNGWLNRVNSFPDL